MDGGRIMKKRNLTNIFCLVIAAVFVFLSVSCSSESQELAPFVENTTETSYDFNGYNFIISGGYKPDYGDSTIGDAVLKRYNDIEEDLNISLEIVDPEYDNYITKMFQSKAVQTKFADIAQTTNEFIFEAFRSGLIIPLNNIDGFDLFSGEFGSEAMLEAIRFYDGNVYGFQAEQWPVKPSICLIGLVMYNPVLVSQFQLSDPHELLENDQWNWANFQTMAKACTDDTIPMYGIMEEWDDFQLDAIFSNGGQVVKYNEDTGKYYYGLLDSESIEALDWTMDLLYVDKSIHAEEYSPDSFNHAFIENRALFLVDDSDLAFGTDDNCPLANMEEGFGWVPFPYGPSNTEHKWYTKTNFYTSYYSIPNSYDLDLSIVIPVIEKLFAPIEGQMQWREYYTKYMISDTESADIFIKMLDESETSNLHIFTRDGRCKNLTEPLKKLLVENKSVVETLQKTADVLQGYIDQEFNQ